MKPQPRKRSKFLSFLLCSTTTHRRNTKKQPPFSPPRRSILEYDDEDSIPDETVRIGRVEEKGSFRTTQGSVDSGAVWSIGSLASRFQNTPSPVCSTCSPVGSLGSDSSGSGGECSFSTPRNQSPSKTSISSVDIDDWIRDCRKRPYGQNSQSTREEGKTWMSCSSVYESAIGGVDQGILESIHEEEINEHVNEEESPFLPYHKLLNRPKPYREFLNEVEKQEFKSKVHARDEAMQNDQIEKLRKREAAIKEWEMKQTRKAARELEELESKQKRERAKAVEKLQQKMARIQSKAAEKKAKGRLSCVSDDANIYNNVVKLSI